MNILEDITDTAGKHRVRVQLPNGDTMFLQYGGTPVQATVDADATKLLTDDDFKATVTADQWRNPTLLTKAEFAARFRELYRAASGEAAWRLAYWLIERITDGTFTDAQVRNAFDMTTGQYTAAKARFTQQHDNFVELRDAVGE